VLYLNHDRSPLLKVSITVAAMGIAGSAIVGSVALDDMSVRGWTRVASVDIAMATLTTRTHRFASCAWTTLPNIECDLISKFHWLETASAVQWIAAIVALFTTSDVRTLLLA
jgi:hypothetical protein